MLQNLTTALLRTHQDGQAREVLRSVALEFTKTQSVPPQLKLWCALGANLDEDWELVEQMLHQTPLDALTDSQKLLHRCAGHAMEALTTPIDTVSLEAEKTFVEAAKAHMDFDAPLRLVNLVRYKVGKRTRRPWIMLEAWRDLHSGCITPLIIIGVLALMAFLRMLSTV